MAVLEPGPKKNSKYKKSITLAELSLHLPLFIEWPVFLIKPTTHLLSFFSSSSSSRGISFEIPLDGDPTLPASEAPPLRGMTRSASSDGLGFKVHYASRGGMRRNLSLTPVNVNGQSRHIPEEEEDFTSHKPLERSNTFSVKNQSRYR